MNTYTYNLEGWQGWLAGYPALASLHGNHLN